MEHGQGIEQHIAGIEIEMGARLGDIGQDVTWLSATPLGSPSVPEVNRIAAGLGGIGPRRQQAGANLPATAVSLFFREVFADILQIDDFGAQPGPTSSCKPRHFDQAAGGDHALHLRGASALFSPASPLVKFSMVGMRP